MEISGKTKIVGIFGYPIEHTLSPAMHNAAFKYLGLDYCYIPFLVHPELLGNAVRAIKALNIVGVNVTIPHKENVIKYLDYVDEEAVFIGAVNTIVNANRKLSGYNTDGIGFMLSLEELNINIDDKKVLVVGAGGASRAIGYYICKRAHKLFIYGRTKEKVLRLINDLRRINDNIYLHENLDDLSEFDMIVNTTPLGLKDEDTLPFNIGLLRANQIVYDLIYKDTRLIKEAKEKGCIAINGKGMLLWQGVKAFEKWTGISPPVDIMRSVLI